MGATLNFTVNYNITNVFCGCANSTARGLKNKDILQLKDKDMNMFNIGICIMFYILKSI